MTAHALASRGERQPAVRDVRSLRVDMTLEAHKPAFASHEQHAIHRPVGRMTGCAAFRLDRRVFKHERTSFFGVTLHTGLPACIAKHHLIARSVGMVAIGALHEGFRNTAMPRQAALTFYTLMSAV